MAITSSSVYGAELPGGTKFDQESFNLTNSPNQIYYALNNFETNLSIQVAVTSTSVYGAELLGGASRPLSLVLDNNEALP